MALRFPLKACSNVSMCGVRLRPWPGTCGGPVFCVCWHGRGIKDREVNGMKRRILMVCLLLALLLTGLRRAEQGAGESAGCEAIGTGGGGSGTSR